MALQESIGRALSPSSWRDSRWAGHGIAGTKLDEEQAATGLGWFSLALGVALLAAPGGIARAIGAPDTAGTRRTLGFVGVREIAAGVTILTEPRPHMGLWARVAGDLMDLALIGTAATSSRANPARLAVAFGAVAGVAAFDAICAERMSTRSTPSTRAREHGVHIVRTVTVDHPAAELYAYWRDFENLPRIMTYLESVETTDDNRSHWVAKGPLGKRLEWDSEVTEEVPGEKIAWESLPGASVWNRGSVQFEEAAGGRGTVIRVELQYVPPAGALGAAVAKLFGRAPEQEIQADLRHFKMLMETGEILQSDSTAKGWGAARPKAETTSPPAATHEPSATRH